jgi:methyltransferase (TIGR00027 family)
MKAGQASRTAVLVCMGRALAHGRSSVARFSDPTALVLLPESVRVEVEHLREQTAEPEDLRQRLRVRYLRTLARLMVARTVSIDDAIRAANARQVVILGAGLDGRAWRMPELRDAIVFEIDHPDSQREKRARLEHAHLIPRAGEVRFVPVDFTRDSLDAALAGAGHDPATPTTWIWEGVVMYLTPAEVDATLAVVAARSAPTSTLAVVYHSPAPILLVVRFFLRRLGEPLRSAFTAERMRAVLARQGFRVVRDDDILGISRSIGIDVHEPSRYGKHVRMAFAVRDGPAAGS